MSDIGGDFKAIRDMDRAELSPKREAFARDALAKEGASLSPGPDGDSFDVLFPNGARFHYWPYTGWFNRLGGPGSGRGIRNLIKEAKRELEPKKAKPGKAVALALAFLLGLGFGALGSPLEALSESPKAQASPEASPQPAPSPTPRPLSAWGSEASVAVGAYYSPDGSVLFVPLRVDRFGQVIVSPEKGKKAEKARRK
jgi:hypothetical protein